MNFKEYSKISFYIVVIMVCAILGLTMFIITFDSWKEYGSNSLSADYNDPNFNIENALPTDIQTQRTLGLLSLVISIGASIGIIVNSIKIENEKIKKMLLFSGGLFSWIFLPLIIKENQKQNGYKMFLNYIFSNNENELPPIIDSNYAKSFSSKEISNKKKYLTILTWLTFLCSIVGIFLIFWPTNNENASIDPKSNVLFDVLIFFTNWTNILVFFFMSIFSFKSNSIIFRKNTFLILTTSWITIVSLVFWFYLFPQDINRGLDIAHPNSLSLVTTIWAHGITPFLFVLSAILIFSTRNVEKTKLSNLIYVGLPYPLIYAGFVYSMPFVARASAYGVITNLNPNNIPISYSEVLNKWELFDKGVTWMAILALFALFAIFILFYFLFWYLNNFLGKKYGTKNK